MKTKGIGIITMNVEQYLQNFFKGTKNPSLDAMKYFVKEFDNPEKNLKFIHIAGTNGKGSTTEMITNILVKAGFKVGKFISPHLVKYNERISINNINITNSELENLINIIKPKIEKYNKTCSIPITLFELETTMALLYFQQNNCDFVVLETGLGGLYDCTNIVNSLISIITSIGFDHTHILGNTLEEIATQKAGIIKPNSDTIFVSQNDVSDTVIEKTCQKQNCKIHKISTTDFLNYSYNNEFQKFDYKKHKNILVNLKGHIQLSNAAIALECMDILNSHGYLISEDAIKIGLQTVIHKARFETICKNPLVIYDGCHNESAVNCFIDMLNMYYRNQTKTFVVSILKTKDYNTILKELAIYENCTFIFTSGNDENKYVSKDELLSTYKKYSKNLELYAMDLPQAIDYVKTKSKTDVNFIIGSFYIYGDVIKVLS